MIIEIAEKYIDALKAAKDMKDSDLVDIVAYQDKIMEMYRELEDLFI